MLSREGNAVCVCVWLQYDGDGLVWSSSVVVVLPIPSVGYLEFQLRCITTQVQKNFTSRAMPRFSSGRVSRPRYM